MFDAQLNKPGSKKKEPTLTPEATIGEAEA